MNINVSESFLESLSKLQNRSLIHWRICDFITETFPTFVKNIWRFRKALAFHRWYDWRGDLLFLSIAFKRKALLLEKYGIEVEDNRLKKISAMNRAAQIIDYLVNDEFVELAEKELGPVIYTETTFVSIEGSSNYEWVDEGTPEEQEHNSKVYRRSFEIEKELWIELFSILKGQDYGLEGFDWERDYNGSGMNSWWD